MVTKMSSSEKQAVERKLLPRLRYMGFLLLFFTIFTLAYALISDPYLPNPEEVAVVLKEEGLPQFSEEPGFMLTKSQRLNLYLIAGAFAVIGLSCLFFYWKKKEQFQDAPPTSGDTAS